MNLARLVHNPTPFAVAPYLLEHREGYLALTVVAKMTWELPLEPSEAARQAGAPAGHPRIAVPRAPIRFESEPRDPSGAWSSLLRPSDAWPEKVGCDVLAVGTVHPSRSGVTVEDVSLRVATGAGLFERTVRVHGPRVWMSGLLGMSPGPAAPLTPTPLAWELAFGGVDAGSPEALIDLRNPSGMGLSRTPANLAGTPAPRIEDPAAPRSSPFSGYAPGVATPAGLGPIPPTWTPALDHLGTLDEAWRRERAPVAPVDRGARFSSAAPTGSWLPAPLEGDEALELTGVTPAGPLRAKLPRYAPTIAVTIRGQTSTHRPKVDTLLVDADARLVELTWRVSVPAPRRAGMIERIAVSTDASLPAWMLPDWEERLEALPDSEEADRGGSP